MKLIFLDIDGVMNSSSGRCPYLADMEAEKLSLLKKLIDESGSTGIVLTSDRRYSEIYMRLFLDALDQYEIFMFGSLRKPKEIEEDPDDNRGKQIMDFLSNIDEEIEKIVILDDNDEGISNLFPDELVIVNRFFGLNEDIYNKAMNILNIEFKRNLSCN